MSKKSDTKEDQDLQVVHSSTTGKFYVLNVAGDPGFESETEAINGTEGLELREALTADQATAKAQAEEGEKADA